MLSYRSTLLIAIATLTLPLAGHAAYKCQSADGAVTFTDRPCPTDHVSESIELKSNTKKPSAPAKPFCWRGDVAKKIKIGMTAAQAHEACGYPDDVNRTKTAYGVHEQWIYGRFPSVAYVYVEDGTVTSIQD
ncbi:DUF4124 domain-containing protein [Marinobacter shengliensis]|uniref:DUF4124 domain-containing protein n=2 Tax=Marinobacter shengliensis TaxID=1389223 RepID=A0ABV4WC13_9GAMM